MPVPRTAAALALAAVGAFAAGCTRTVVATRPVPRPAGAVLGVPPGHLPRPGECRVWLPGRPPGQQPRPRSRPCAGVGRDAPAGSWILFRPTADRRLVHVRVVDDRRPGIVIRVRVFEIESGRFVREENP